MARVSHGDLKASDFMNGLWRAEKTLVRSDT